MNNETFEEEIGGKLLKARLGGFAEQAAGSCLIQFGDTTILATAQIGETRKDLDFFPLTCEFQEKFYAVGKILGSRFMRREGRPSIRATLNTRIIDRAIRPLFPKELTNEIQVIATCLSLEDESDPACAALNAASLALGISEIPWFGPVAAVRIGKDGQNFVVNPTVSQREEYGLDIILVGTEKRGKILINMIEAGCVEEQEKTMLDVYDFALPFIKQIIDFQKRIIEKSGKTKIEIAKRELGSDLDKKIKNFIDKGIEQAIYQKDNQKRKKDLKQVQDDMLAEFEAEIGEDGIQMAKDLFDEEIERIFKENIIKKEKRPDGRNMDEVRDILCEANVLPRVHGSGMFTRGKTRILSVLTLGSPGDQLLVDGMEDSGKKRFLHHYNFPPYSVGEVGRISGPGRREIGHGMLAAKAIIPLLPPVDKFPYTIRIVSEALSSNGSTSMASVSASSLALMDGGVPIKRHITGIAIGLVIGQNIEEFKLLTDIQGPEDHYGEMDFKVAGTEKGITAVQMDVKTEGITRDIMEKAFERAKKARLEILEKMKQAIPKSRENISPNAPKISILKISPAKIGAVIGTGGKIINGLIDDYDVTIDIDDNGEVFVSGLDEKKINNVIEKIKNLTREFEVGEIFNGKVVSIKDFGAFVELIPGKDGLVHISELAPFRVNKVGDVVKENDIIPVKILSIGEDGKISLSARQAGFKPMPKNRAKR